MTPSKSTMPVPRHDIVLPRSADGATFAIYRAASAAEVEVSLPEGARAEDFFVDGTVYQLPRATLTRVKSCAQHMRRGPVEIAQDAAPTLQLYLHVDAEVDVVVDGRPLHFGPGDMVLYDSRQAFEARAGDFDVRTLRLSRDLAPAILLSPDVHGLKLAGEEAGARVLAAWVEHLVAAIDGMTIAEADHAVAAIWQFAAGLVEARLAARGARPWIEPTLEAALAYIGGRLRDPDLSPEDVRAHLGISRSGIYRMFEPFGGIGAVIRRRRIEAALRTLLSGTAPGMGLGELAHAHGFGKETTFVRAFEAHFGTPPKDFRVKVAAGDGAWLQDQAHRAGFSSLEAWIVALAG